MTTDLSLRYVTPEGLASNLLAVTISMAVVSLVTVSLRCIIRLQEHNFGLDDGIMLAGLMFFTADGAIAAYGCYVGFGTLDEDLNFWFQSEALKYLMVWELLGAFTAACIKCSVVITLIRITAQKIYIMILHAILITSIATCLFSIISALVYCQPIAANWKLVGDYPGHTEDCGPTGIAVLIGVVSTVSSILTDFACAILPGFILWKVHMAFRLKMLVWLVLGLGASAAIATIVRTQYLAAWNSRTNQLYNVANFIIWSQVEVGIGMAAGSLASLRRFFMRWTDKKDSPRGNAGAQISLNSLCPT